MFNSMPDLEAMPTNVQETSVHVGIDDPRVAEAAPSDVVGETFNQPKEPSSEMQNLSAETIASESVEPNVTHSREQADAAAQDAKHNHADHPPGCQCELHRGQANQRAEARKAAREARQAIAKNEATTQAAKDINQAKDIPETPQVNHHQEQAQTKQHAREPIGQEDHIAHQVYEQIRQAQEGQLDQTKQEVLSPDTKSRAFASSESRTQASQKGAIDKPAHHPTESTAVAQALPEEAARPSTTAESTLSDNESSLAAERPTHPIVADSAELNINEAATDQHLEPIADSPIGNSEFGNDIPLADQSEGILNIALPELYVTEAITTEFDSNEGLQDMSVNPGEAEVVQLARVQDSEPAALIESFSEPDKDVSAEVNPLMSALDNEAVDHQLLDTESNFIRSDFIAEEVTLPTVDPVLGETPDYPRHMAGVENTELSPTGQTVLAAETESLASIAKVLNEQAAPVIDTVHSNVGHLNTELSLLRSKLSEGVNDINHEYSLVLQRLKTLSAILHLDLEQFEAMLQLDITKLKFDDRTLEILQGLYSLTQHADRKEFTPHSTSLAQQTTQLVRLTRKLGGFILDILGKKQPAFQIAALSSI